MFYPEKGNFKPSVMKGFSEIIATSETVDPNRLGKEEKDRLVHELFYAVQCRIFQGTDEKSFAGYIFHPHAVRTRIKIFRNDQKEPVGYFSIHLFEIRSIDSGIRAIFRAEAGLLLPYRRKHSTLSLAFAEFLRYKCRHPNRKAYFLGTLVHPSSYHLVFRHFYEMYPTCRCETPPQILDLMRDIAKHFGIEPVCRDNPLIVRVGWGVRNGRESLDFWSHSDEPDVQFFLKTNPRYLEGEGLLTLIPLSWKNLLWLFIRWVLETWRRKLRNMT